MSPQQLIDALSCHFYPPRHTNEKDVKQWLDDMLGIAGESTDEARTKAYEEIRNTREVKSFPLPAELRNVLRRMPVSPPPRHIVGCAGHKPEEPRREPTLEEKARCNVLMAELRKAVANLDVSDKPRPWRDVSRPAFEQRMRDAQSSSAGYLHRKGCRP